MTSDSQYITTPSSLYLYLDCSACSTAMSASAGWPMTRAEDCKAGASSGDLQSSLGGLRLPEIVVSGPGLSSCPCAGSFIDVARRSCMRLCFDTTSPIPMSLPTEWARDGDTVIVQLDSLHPSVHDEFHELPGLHAKTMALIRRLPLARPDSRGSPRLAVKTAVRCENYRDLRKMAEMLADLGCQEWVWDFETRLPYSFLTDTQARELYDERHSIGRYCVSNGIAIRTSLTAEGEADLRVLGDSMNGIAASCVGVFPSNANCRVATDIAALELRNLTLAACPLLARRPSASPRLPLRSAGGPADVRQAWADPTFVEARRQHSLLTKETCTNCTPALRRLHQDIEAGDALQDGHKTGWRPAALPGASSCNAALRPIEAGGILLDYRCNAACEHCLYASDGRTGLSATRSLVTEIAGTLASVSKGPRGFHISGGEPFLDLPLLKHAIRQMAACGLRLEFVETNGSWGSKPTARSMLLDLRSCGLERIRFSASPFHEPFIKRSSLLKAVELAREVLGRESVYVFGRASLETDSSVQVPFDLVPGGRAGYFMAQRGGGMPASTFGNGCAAELLDSGHAHFDAEGNVTPGVCTGISICRVRDLPAACAGLTLTPLLQGLVSEGPASLWRFAKRHFGYEELSSGYAGKCHLCVDVRLHLVRNAASSFPELAPLVFYEGVERYRKSVLRGGVKADSIRWDSATSRSQV